jgi:hypothetical protein
MSLTLLTYLLVLISNEDALEVGQTQTDLECAMAIGYLVRNAEQQGAAMVGRMQKATDGSFSVNVRLPAEGEEPGQMVSMTCSPEIV